MITLSQLILIFGAVLSAINCNCGPCGSPPKHYEELGCVGNYIDGPCCPNERFECPDLATLDTNVCHYKGKTYEIGDTVADADSPICQLGCVCDKGFDGVAQFECPIAECGDWFLPTKPDCVKQYSLNQCCSVNRICGKEAYSLHQCHYYGKSYTYGERFNPESNYFYCYNCICDEDFDNSTNIDVNKNCKKINCGMELNNLEKFRRGCVPIYIKHSKCCPIDFQCPNKNDKVMPYEGLPDIDTVKAEALCKFGNLTLQRRQSIETSDECLECICKKPPMIECIKNENCD